MSSQQDFTPPVWFSRVVEDADDILYARFSDSDIKLKETIMGILERERNDGAVHGDLVGLFEDIMDRESQKQ